VNKSKRDVLKSVAFGSVWATPIVNSVMIPAHAQTSDTVSGTFRGSLVDSSSSAVSCISNACIEIIISDSEVTVNVLLGPSLGVELTGTGVLENNVFDFIVDDSFEGGNGGSGSGGFNEVPVMGTLNTDDNTITGTFGGPGGNVCATQFNDFTAVLDAACPVIN